MAANSMPIFIRDIFCIPINTQYPITAIKFLFYNNYKTLLDRVHKDLPVQQYSYNTYTLGSIGKYNIVIACLPSGEYGIASATTVAMQLLSSFRSIRFGLVVGISRGVPNKNVDIRLGDIVVSKPTNTHGGVIQAGIEHIGMLNHPPTTRLPQKATTFARPDEEDCLYRADYTHVNIDTKPTRCHSCDATKIVPRPSRSSNEPAVHYGLIASANQVVKDSLLRDKLGEELDVYCVETEAAGFMNNFPCLVIRGICDYADSHKNKDWQGYAAAAAATYARELLLPPSYARDLSRISTPSEVPANPLAATSHSELEGVHLGTIRGSEIIPRLIQYPEYWRREIHELIQRLLSMHPQWWIHRQVETARAINDFFARHRFTFRVNIFPTRTPRPEYPDNDRQYLNILFDHNIGWLNRFEEGTAEINIGILNLWSIFEFLDRDL
ncbi:nucleoside phosphorylase domain-containing protein [Aspergillus pseudotamarii]|uniref:Nucleoside phosphorylase domain-containing protein n=1 Tax=Aspergillus pseudotamarii TaxID=132259 RepID=A0A5N6SMA3_ASPPS|nr:nucleoside phosphorylase domain-containing protein [Aspergillus pseudotamarii]KAE8135695.1 nucleoside phosphorylase domain-containing protein [Aspergillus pseudotamarii]